MWDQVKICPCKWTLIAPKEFELKNQGTTDWPSEEWAVEAATLFPLWWRGNILGWTPLNVVSQLKHCSTEIVTVVLKKILKYVQPAVINIYKLIYYWRIIKNSWVPGVSHAGDAIISWCLGGHREHPALVYRFTQFFRFFSLTCCCSSGECS